MFVPPPSFRIHDVYIPKFSIKTSYKLNDVLPEMGMTDMFDVRANLRGISEEQRLAVSELRWTWDETGAEAAAVTGIGIMPISSLPVWKFNRPFMVIITEHNTEKILFLGKIINPTI
uniref:Thyroxine-binding globulin n=1 Tax=Sander lucioperca TaxID=283035 RepID=A0A8C9Z885_SANLU